jgi:hypothetical protein
VSGPVGSSTLTRSFASSGRVETPSRSFHFYCPAAGAAADPRARDLEFLLEHEPKEAILSRFELPVIEHYFPDYPAALRSRHWT